MHLQTIAISSGLQVWHNLSRATDPDKLKEGIEAIGLHYPSGNKRSRKAAIKSALSELSVWSNDIRPNVPVSAHPVRYAAPKSAA